MWLKSEYDSQDFADPNGGGTFAKECYLVTEEELIYFVVFLLEDYKDPEWESFWGDIEGLNYEETLTDFEQLEGYQEGNYYKIRYTRLYFSKEQPAPLDYFSDYEIQDKLILQTIKK